MVSTALRPHASLSPATEELTCALLSCFVTSICMPKPGFPFDEHNNFIGKKRLKNALMELLPLREFVQVGLNCERVRQLLGELFKAGLVEKLVLEAKRRKNDDVEPGQWSARSAAIEAATNRNPGVFTDGSSTMLTSKTIGPSVHAIIQQENSRDDATYGPDPDFARAMVNTSRLPDQISCVPRLTIGRQRGRSDTTGCRRVSYDNQPGPQLFIQPPDTKPHMFINYHSARKAPTLSPTSECPFSRSPQSQSPSPTPSVDEASHNTGLEKASGSDSTRALLPICLRLQLLTTLQRKLEVTCYYFAKKYRFHEVFLRKPDWEPCAKAAELQQWSCELIRELKRHRGVNTGAVYASDMITALSTLVSLRHDAVHRNAVTGRILAHIGRALEFVRLVQIWPQEGNTKDRTDGLSLHQPSHMHLDLGAYLSKLEKDLLAVQEAMVMIIQEEDANIKGQFFNRPSGSFVAFPESEQHRNVGEPSGDGGAKSGLRDLIESLWDFVIDSLGEETTTCQLQRSHGAVGVDTPVH